MTDTLRIKLTHWAEAEGRDAAASGYRGKNPYHDTRHAWQWQEGYLHEVQRRLIEGLDALPREREGGLY